MNKYVIPLGVWTKMIMIIGIGLAYGLIYSVHQLMQHVTNRGSRLEEPRGGINPDFNNSTNNMWIKKRESVMQAK